MVDTLNLVAKYFFNQVIIYIEIKTNSKSKQININTIMGRILSSHS